MTFIDSSALIPLFKEEDFFKKKMFQFFESFDAKNGKLFASVACLMELKFVLKRFKKTNIEIRQAISAVLSMPIEFIEIDSDLIEDSLEYVEQCNLGFFDAIIVASMVEKRDFSIISFDEDFDRVEFIKRIKL